MNTTIIIIAVLFLLFLVYKSRTQSQGDFTNIGAGELNKLLKDNPDLVILDVRMPKEVAGGKVKNALEINVLSPNFSKEIANLDKSKPYLVYCRSGNRSAKACNTMSKQAFGNLYNLQGGYSAWLKKDK
ncbi:MAG: rhodanese-like domain-containing protein [Saprospiraceae bacterium]